jgi:hypothetical protein
MKPNGCAVYVKSNENHYLISATHVLDTFKNRCGVQLNNQAIIPKGKLFLSLNKLGQDKVDIGVLRLDEFAIKHISSVYTQPLSIDNIETSCSEQQLGEGYFIFGYPATNKHVDVKMGTGSILCEPLFYLTDDCKIDYASIGYNKAEHIILNNDTHEIKRVNDTNVPVIKSLEGISGCGLWKTGYKFIDGKNEPYLHLIGIVNFNYSNKTQNYIVATRIDFITEILRIHFGENMETTTVLPQENFQSAFAGFD